MSRRMFPHWRGVAGFLVVGACTLVVAGWLAPVQAAPPAVTNSQTGRVATIVERLHASAVTRSKADEDDKASKLARNPALSRMAPERAVQLAVAYAGGGKPMWVARRTGGDGKPYYHVRVDRDQVGVTRLPAAELHVDAESENVRDGSNDDSDVQNQNQNQNENQNQP